MKQIFKDQRGTAIVLFVLMFTVICGISGLVVDLGYVFYNKHKLQNAVDAAALAAAQQIINNPGQITYSAEDIAEKNGVSPSELTINHPYQVDENKVEVSATQMLDYFFMQILGFNSTTISARAVAMRYNCIDFTDEALKYAIFSGSTSLPLTFAGEGSIINGDVHGNNNVSLHGVGHTINGNVSAVGTISSINDTITGTITEGSPKLPIPVFDFNTYAYHADKVFNEDVTLNGEVTIDGIWLVNGNIHISGCRVSGKGIILATGEIQISGSLEYNTYKAEYYASNPEYNEILEYNSSDSLLSLYSQTDIQISAVNADIYGVLYAPNGQIRINGSGNTVHGALIADQVTWAGSDIVINGDYDIRTPGAFTTEKEVFALIE